MRSGRERPPSWVAIMAPPLIGGSLTPRLSMSSSVAAVGLQVGTLVGSIFPQNLDCVDIGRRQAILRFAAAPSRRSALLRSRSATCGLDGAPANLSMAIVAGHGDDHGLGAPREHRYIRLCQVVDADDSRRYCSRHHESVVDWQHPRMATCGAHDGAVTQRHNFIPAP